MATQEQLHERMEKLDAHLKQVRAELADLDERQRVKLGELLEEMSGKFDERER